MAKTQYFHIDSCPSCGTRPYPAGIACKTCGFIGVGEDSIQRARRVWFPWIALGTILAMIIIVLLFLASLGAL